MAEAKFIPPHDTEIGCNDHIIDQVPISTMSNPLLYYSREIGRLKLIQNGWISLYTLNFGVKCKERGAEILTNRDSKAGMW